MPTSLDIGPDVRPHAALTDKGYDAQSNRTACRARGIVPVITRRANARNQPALFPKLLHNGRARIEQVEGKLKRFKRIALRCEKTAENYGSLVAFACTGILVKSVHTAWDGARPQVGCGPAEAFVAVGGASRGEGREGEAAVLHWDAR
ncbi:MAG: hypothetical protein EON55_09760 [Alphaproteobacteria bacterium]|nr:MAG: hypothetical protein EON55_09760 [Alphaproteobacteria bacterium]